METFITSVCTIENNIETCNYGGVILYSLVLIFLLILSGIAFWGAYKIITKLL